MIKNYFKIARRQIRRHKVFTLINVAGLAIGLCACLSIYVITSHEFSYDRFHEDQERIYRVMGDVTEKTGIRLHFGRLPLGVAEKGKAEVTGVENIAGVIPFNAKIAVPITNQPATTFESNTGETHFTTTVIAQPEYFDIFKYKWLAGNPASFFQPLKVVLTESRAQQYFGRQAPNQFLGREIVYDDSLRVTVSGIIQDWDKNSDLAFRDFISAATLRGNYLGSRINTDSWSERFMNTWTFVKLAEGANGKAVEAQMNALVTRNAAPTDKLALWLEPLSELHFNADVIENSIRTADRPTLYTLVAIAVFILILAIINFINLSTAQSLYRAKEVGVRKVLGSARSGLMFQFFVETFILALLAVSIAVLLVQPVLSTFQSFIPNGIKFQVTNIYTLGFLIAVTLITTLLAGWYPAKVLSSHLPALNLKGNAANTTADKWWLRKGLIVFQFSVSLIFILVSLVISEQLKFTRKKDPGFSSDAIVIVPTPWGDSLSRLSLFANQVRSLSSVKNAATQWLPPMTDNGRVMQLRLAGNDSREIEVGQVAGDENFIPLYQIKLLAGKNLVAADSVKEYVINESFQKYLGFKDPHEAIGKMLYWNGNPHPIVGVVADFHTASFHDPITPLCIINRPDRQHSLAIRLATANEHSPAIKKSLQEVERIWKRIYPAGTFKFEFFDESLALLYEKDERAATLMNTAMAITIFISCIGLFGLMLFTSKKRAKEISIRKILGAGFANIVMMLVKEFAIIIVIALLLASPFAWFLMHSWLENFAYRVSIKWWYFLSAGAFALLITLLTIGFQAIKAAIENPVKSLRTE